MVHVYCRDVPCTVQGRLAVSHSVGYDTVTFFPDTYTPVPVYQRPSAIPSRPNPIKHDKKMMRIAEALLERNVAPDWLVRIGIRRLLAMRLSQESSKGIEEDIRHKMHMLSTVRSSQIAIEQDKVNEQHYELPTDFFQLHLGNHLKYSSAYFTSPDCSLDDGEEVMLRMYCERAGVTNGMTILDLGCGWGSLSLYLAQHYPNCRIIGLSNSWTQREFIESKARESGFKNLKIITADVAQIGKIEGGMTFDAIISIEMLEHMRNFDSILRKISQWLNKDGKLFTHTFCHNKYIYFLETAGSTNWMGRYFFTGGTMMCDDIFTYFQDDLRVVNRWRVNGRHYAQTAELWLKKFDTNILKLRPFLRATYGDEAVKWEAFWRTFYMSVAELFGYKNGQEWHVAHYLFEKR